MRVRGGVRVRVRGGVRVRVEGGGACSGPWVEAEGGGLISVFLLAKGLRCAADCVCGCANCV